MGTKGTEATGRADNLVPDSGALNTVEAGVTWSSGINDTNSVTVVALGVKMKAGLFTISLAVSWA